MALETNPWNVQDHLKTTEDVAGYLEAAFELNDPAALKAALRDVAKSQGIKATAEKIGITREGLSKALSPDGDPKLSTILPLLGALGLRIRLDVAA